MKKPNSTKLNYMYFQITPIDVFCRLPVFYFANVWKWIYKIFVLFLLKKKNQGNTCWRFFFYISFSRIKCMYFICIWLIIRRNEITTQQGCLMWGIWVIIPTKFWKKILETLHASHWVVKMKGIARSYVWLPGIEKEIKNVTKLCRSC